MTKVTERLTALETLIPVIHDTLKKLDERMEGMDHVIRGNGSPGLVEKQATMALELKALKDSRNRYRDFLFTVVGGVAVGITLSIFNSWSPNRAIKNLPAMQQKP